MVGYSWLGSWFVGAWTGPGGSAGSDARGDLGPDGEDVALAEDQVLVAVDLDLRAAVLAVDDLVAFLHLEGHALAVFEASSSNGEDAATLRLLLGGVREHDATRRDFLLLEHLDDHAIAQRLQIHARSSCGKRISVYVGDWHSRAESADSR